MAASLVRTVRFREGAEESRREEYRKCRERLTDPAKASTSDLWRRYEDAYNALCIELLRTDDEHQALKNRMSGSELVDMLKFHILAAPARKYQIGTQTDNKTALKKMNFPVEPVGGVIWQFLGTSWAVLIPLLICPTNGVLTILTMVDWLLVSAWTMVEVQR